MKQIIILIILISFISCNQKKQELTNKTAKPAFAQLRDSLKVGMTYDEVEKLLGKPTSIERGFTEWYHTTDLINQLKNEELEYLKTDTSLLTDPRFLGFHELRTVGDLMYVRWVYDSLMVVDSCYTVNFKHEQSKKPAGKKYLLISENPHKVLEAYEDDYNRIKIGDEWGESHKITQKKIEQEYVSVPVVTGVDKIYHKYIKMFGILFDASSGRLVASDIYPYKVILSP